jgi:signal transduction histidine kinase
MLAIRPGSRKDVASLKALILSLGGPPNVLPSALTTLAFAASVMLAPRYSVAGAIQEPRPGLKTEQPAALILSGEDLTRPWVRGIVSGIRDAILEKRPDVTVYQEFLDSPRFENADYIHGIRDWLRKKYYARRLDLLVVIGQDAVDFLSRGRGEPWPGVPVVYADIGALTIDISQTLPGATGVVFEDTLRPALGVIKTILPGTKRVALIYGASPLEQSRFSGWAARVREIDPNLEAMDLGGLTMGDVLKRVAHLPGDAVILNLTVQVDAAGERFAARRPCELISAAANRPLFSQGGQEFGCGIVGGVLRNWDQFGRMLGQQALGRLSGQSPQLLTVPVAEFTSLLFDARQLERWGIDERLLPPGSEVRFQPPSLWRDYRPQVIGALAVAALQALLIGGLLFERRRRRRAELDSRQHLVMMSHMDRRAAMGQLATSLAHELNQPLNAILQNAGVLELLLASKTGAPPLDEIREIVGDIRKDDMRASEVIRRMRGLLQKRELQAQPVDVNELSEDTIALVRPDATSRAIHIEMELTEGLPPIRGDRVHLQQVLLNLLLNAMESVARMPSDRRSLVVRTSQNNGTVTLAVQDAGVGIPPDRINDVFEPFYTTKGEGMGMGLAIARSIVEAHEGRMAAENNANGGATVWFSVPSVPGQQS